MTPVKYDILEDIIAIIKEDVDAIKAKTPKDEEDCKKLVNYGRFLNGLKDPKKESAENLTDDELRELIVAMPEFEEEVQKRIAGK